MTDLETLRAVAALDDAGKDTEALRQLSQRPRAKAHHLVREHAAPITLPRVSCLESEG